MAPQSEGIILLVEDNPDDEVLTLRAITKKRIANPVVVVRDGREALDYMFGEGVFHERDTRALPAVILLDLKLPKVDGLEVLRALRNHPLTRVVPIVVLTTSNEDQDIVKSYSFGANSYVRKPVDFEQFTEAVGQLGMYWLLTNEPPPNPPMEAPE